MKITDVCEIKAEEITMDNGSIYRRYDYDNWEQLYGMSWEEVTPPPYSDACIKLEKLYQDYINKTNETS